MDTTDIIDQLKTAQKLKPQLKKFVNNGQIASAKEALMKYEKYAPGDVDIYNIKVVILFEEGRFEEAEKLAIEATYLHPYNFDLLYNLANIFESKMNFIKAAETYSRALKVADKDEEVSEIKEKLKSLEVKNAVIKDHSNHKVFPFINKSETYINKALTFDNSNISYYSQYYKEPLLEYPINYWHLFKSEILQGEKKPEKNLSLTVDCDSVLPVSIPNKSSYLKLYIDENLHNFSNVASKRFNYYPVKGGSKITIESDSDLFLGKPIPVNQKYNNRYKLILCLFIDGLSSKALEGQLLEQTMPHTAAFFQNGALFKNCHSTSEWTLPSVASIFSGLYQSKHKVSHPELHHVIGEHYNILSEYMQQEGYLTSQFCGNWRKTPAYGYAKGFDRTIYQSAMSGSSTQDILFNFFEHIRAFPKRSNFAWLTFMELHHLMNGLPDISNQVCTSIEAHDYREGQEKSVFHDYNELKVERYFNELKRIDFYLQLIYSYINNNYKNDEVLVILLSDHGQSYLSKDDHLLSDYRTHVPLFIKGGGVPIIESNNLISTVDILPLILKLCETNTLTKRIDGTLPSEFGGQERNNVYSESLFPGQTFKAAIKDKNHKFYFESSDNVRDDGRVCLLSHSSKLLDKDNNDITEKESELSKKYKNLILENAARAVYL